MERLENATQERIREEGELSDTGLSVWQSFSSAAIVMRNKCAAGGNAHRSRWDCLTCMLANLCNGAWR